MEGKSVDGKSNPGGPSSGSSGASSAGPDTGMFLPDELCDDLCCCVICFEPFSDHRIPKALPCLHTFCKDCLANNLTAHKKQVAKKAPSRSRLNEMKNFACPVCKEVTKVPENGIDGFKNDFRIRKISEVLAKTRSLKHQQSYAELQPEKDSNPQNPSKEEDTEKEENSERRVLCDICRFSDKEKEAALYCLECAKMLCRECAEDHINTAITKDHDIVNANEHLPTESVCQMHPAELLKYFCTSCEMPVCMACTYSEAHKGHEIMRLPEHTKQIREKLQHLLDGWQEGVPDLSQKTKELASLEQTLTSKEKTAQKAILQRTLEEISKVRSKQSKMEQELEEICRQKYKELQKKKKELADTTEKIEFTKTLMMKGQDLQLVCMENELIKGLENIAEPRSEANSGEFFTDLGKYEGLVEDIEIIQKDESTTRSAILADIKSVVSQMRMFSVGRSEAKPELLKKVGRKGTKDGEFNFPSGVVILPNGDVAVADLHNHRVQIFTAEGEFKNKFGNEDFKPCGITVTREGFLAVTDCNLNANCIKVYTPDGIHKQSLGVGEFDYPFSVAINSKGRYVVSDPAVNKITVINAEGSLHRRFGTRSKFCFYLTVNTRDEIVLSDWYNHCVKVFSSNGQLLRKVGSHGIEDGQLLIPLGVVTDLRGNILVLDCKCGRLSMFAPDGRFIKNLINKTHGIEYSRALAIARDGRMVLTTGDNKREVPNELHIYQLL